MALTLSHPRPPSQAAKNRFSRINFPSHSFLILILILILIPPFPQPSVN
jgi:hypothetical protein